MYEDLLPATPGIKQNRDRWLELLETTPEEKHTDCILLSHDGKMCAFGLLLPELGLIEEGNTVREGAWSVIECYLGLKDAKDELFSYDLTSTKTFQGKVLHKNDIEKQPFKTIAEFAKMVFHDNT